MIIRARKSLLWLLGGALAIALASAAGANMIQLHPVNQSVFDNGGAPWPFFSSVAAINYDKGGQGVGYNVPVPDPTNCPAGSSYRADAVNLKTSTAGGAAIPFQIGCAASPNSYNYTVNISQSGPYQITLQVGSASTGGSWNVLLDGVIVANVSTPNTGSYNTFAASSSGQFTASLGNHKLTLAWGTGDSQFASAGDLLTWQGAVAPPVTINSVSMDCGNSCSFTGGVAGTVGHAQAVMSTGSFTGTWGTRTSSTDNFGATCKNWTGSLAISSSGTVTNGAIANGTYDGFCIVATQAGAGGSPFAQAVTITGSSGGVTTPTIAANAGFTTLAGNFDFSLPAYATQSNWLDCSGTNTNFVWHAVHAPLPCSAFNQVHDPVTGETVLNVHWSQSYQNFGQGGNNNFAEIDTATTDSTGDINTFSYPLNAYVEVVMRDTAWDNASQPGNSNGPDGVWTWSTTLAHWEIDFDEVAGTVSGQFGTPAGRSSAIPWNNPGGFACNWDTNAYQCRGWNVAGNFSMSSFHKYGSLITGNGALGTGNKQICAWIDDVLQGCGDMSPGDSSALGQRNWIKVWIGGASNPLPDKDIYIKYIRVFDCANWNSGSGPANQCNGSSLFNSSGLTYWH